MKILKNTMGHKDLVKVAKTTIASKVTLKYFIKI